MSLKHAQKIVFRKEATNKFKNLIFIMEKVAVIKREEKELVRIPCFDRYENKLNYVSSQFNYFC